jgi:uncharacterized protein HemX
MRTPPRDTKGRFRKRRRRRSYRRNGKAPALFSQQNLVLAGVGVAAWMWWTQQQKAQKEKEAAIAAAARMGPPLPPSLQGDFLGM